MSRRLMALNALLLVLIVAAAWRMRAVWIDKEGESASILRRPVAPMPPPVVLLPPPAQPVSPAAYFDVAQQLMFSADRNPTVILDVEAPKLMPPLPRYYGMFNFGQGPRVVLAASSGGPQRSYQPGQEVGAFKLVSISASGLVFEWDGKHVPAGFAELRDARAAEQPVQQSGDAAPSTPARGAAATPRAAASTTIGGNVNAGPAPSSAGSDSNLQMRGCVAGDTSPAGTIVDGYRKVLREGPFGKSCSWEKVE